MVGWGVPRMSYGKNGRREVYRSFLTISQSERNSPLILAVELGDGAAAACGTVDNVVQMPVPKRGRKEEALFWERA